MGVKSKHGPPILNYFHLGKGGRNRGKDISYKISYEISYEIRLAYYYKTTTTTTNSRLR